MIYQFEEREYRIRFQYNHNPNPKSPQRFIPIDTPYGKMRGITQCDIETKRTANDYWEPVRYGIAYCISADPFNKDIGRKISLTRALYSFDVEHRRVAWKAYLTRRES